MATTTFVRGTKVTKEWLNDVNSLVYTLFGGLSSVPTSGKVFRSNGTTLVGSTFTIADTYTIGDILQATSANVLTALAGVATGNALISGGVATANAWGKIGLTTHISGTLGIGNGGTGQTTAALARGAIFDPIFTTKGDIVVATANATAVRQGIGSDKQVLVADSAQTNGLKWFTPTQTRQVFTSGSGATYTTPAGVTRINIRMVGGGGGGGGSGNGTAGTASTWSGGSLSAGGGAASVGAAGSAATAAAASNGDINIAGATGTPGCNTAVTNSGFPGANSIFGGGGGGGGGNAAGPGASGAAATNSGSGGGGGGSAAAPSGSGGNAGAYVEKLIVAPAATYTYTVGSAGTGGTSSASVGAGGAGAAGLIIVDEYYT